MTLFSPRQSEKFQTSCRRSYFLGALKPFICLNRPFVCALIGHNRPFVSLSRNSGFTLIELIITLAVASILLFVAVPSFQTFMKNSRITTQNNDLIADLTYARSEAVKRGITVSVCKSTNPTASSPTCNTTDADPWTTGRLVFVDNDGDGQLDASDQVLRARQSLSGSGNKLLGDGSATGTANVVTFNNTGMTTLTTESEIKSCDDRGGDYGRSIVISTTGRTRLSDKGEDMAGNTLSC